MPKFTGYIEDCNTMHSAYPERDLTTVKIKSIQGEDNHFIDVSRIDLTGPAQEMKKFIDAKRSSIVKEKKFPKVRITIDLDEPEENEIQAPAPSLFPFLNDTLLTLVLTT